MWPFRIFRGNRDLDARYLEQVRRVLAESCDLLQHNLPPDSFAGRKTQEPFPKEDHALDGWLNALELQAPK